MFVLCISATLVFVLWLCVVVAVAVIAGLLLFVGLFLRLLLLLLYPWLCYIFFVGFVAHNIRTLILAQNV